VCLPGAPRERRARKTCVHLRPAERRQEKSCILTLLGYDAGTMNAETNQPVTTPSLLAGPLFSELRKGVFSSSLPAIPSSAPPSSISCCTSGSTAWRRASPQEGPIRRRDRDEGARPPTPLAARSSRIFRPAEALPAAHSLFASFKLTYHCNLSCGACPFHRRSGEANAHITWTDAVRALDELKRRGTRIVVFEGGEPFVWRDGNHGLGDLVEYAKQRFLRVAVTTNGTLPST